MRVLLDAHVSSRRVGRPLQTAGHDVLALDQDPSLASLSDDDVLALAAELERIVVTHNVKHFAPIVRRWMEAEQTHAGCILITLPHTAYGAILRGLKSAFTLRPSQEDWENRMEFLGVQE